MFFGNLQLRCRFQELIATKWTLIDQDNLRIETFKAVAHLMSFAQITCLLLARHWTVHCLRCPTEIQQVFRTLKSLRYLVIFRYTVHMLKYDWPNLRCYVETKSRKCDSNRIPHRVLYNQLPNKLLNCLSPTHENRDSNLNLIQFCPALFSPPVMLCTAATAVALQLADCRVPRKVGHYVFLPYAH